jgi:hypothetical protein
MKNYRLKKEAVQFFLEKHATSIYSQDTWKSLGVDVKALEEVKDAYLSFGHKMKDATSLSGWDESGTHFLFTIHFPSVKFHEHDTFSKGRMSRQLMDRIQSNIENFYIQFANGDES